MIKEDLKKYLELLEKDDQTNLEISKWSVHKHVEHILVSDSIILKQLLEPKEKVDSGITILGRLVLTFGFIPRGKGKAPKFSQPNGLSKQELKQLYTEILINIDKAQNISSKKIIAEHPYFGGLTKKQWLKFINIHQKHHLKIIDEIIKKN